MSASSSSDSTPNKRYPIRKWWLAFLYVVWVVIGFYAAQLLTVGLIWLLKWLGFEPGALNEAVFNTLTSTVIYILSLVIVMGVPWLIKKISTNRRELGLTRLPSWSDIGLAPVGFVVYIVISALLLWLCSTYLPGIDLDQAQDVGFNAIGRRYEYVLAFATLVVLAPLAEELLFRGYLYGKIRKIVPVWLAIIIVSLLFGFVHGQWNTAIDTFALSLILCGLREITGSVWSSVLLHMLKNGIAFFILFINPILSGTLGLL